MLNLSQRLILGCTLLACLTIGLAVGERHALAAAGQRGLMYSFMAAAIVVAITTVLVVLRPVHRLARDAQRIAQGNLEHRVEWDSRDDFGVIAERTEPHRGPAARSARHRGRTAADGVPALRRGAAIDL